MVLEIALVVALTAAPKAPDLSKVKPGRYDFDRLTCAAGSSLVRERTRLDVNAMAVQLTVTTATSEGRCGSSFPSHPDELAWKDERTETFQSPGKSGRFAIDGGSFTHSCATKKQEVHSPEVAFECDGPTGKPTSYAPKQVSGLGCTTSDQKLLFAVADAGFQTVARTGSCATQAVRSLTRARFPRTEANLKADLSALGEGSYTFERMLCDAAPGLVHYGRATLEVNDAGVRLTRTRMKVNGSCAKGFPELVRLDTGSTTVESDGRTGLFEWADAKGVEGKELWRCEASTQTVHARNLDLVLPPPPKGKKADAACPARLDMTAKSKTQKALNGIRCETSANELWFWAPDAGVIETAAKESPCGSGEAFRVSR
jgi:hypothetical protein